MSDELRGRHAIVTGGGGGLGAAIAAALAAEGATLTVMGRTPATLEAQADRLGATGARVRAVVCDVADAASISRAFADAVSECGPAHALINSAGHAEAAPLEETTLEAWQRTITVNLTGTFLCIQEVLPAMIATGSGRIINIASTAGLRGYAQVSAYCAAKHGVVGLTRALAAETARRGVTVNAVCPGYIEGSPMLDAAIANVVRSTGKSVTDARALLSRRSPDGRFATLQDVTDAVVHLCSAEAAATTGQAIVVAGGEVIS